MILIYDIDGTVARINATRLKLLQLGKFDEFAAGTNQDRPIRPTIKILQWAYQRGLELHAHTGRGEGTDGVCRAATENWLWDWNIPFTKVLMRPEGNLDPDYMLKWGYIRQGGYSIGNVFCVLEDRTRCADLYRSLGFFTLQVAKNVGLDTQQRGMLNTAAAKLAGQPNSCPIAIPTTFSVSPT